MATILDTFVTEFALDPSKFTKGQKEVLGGIKNLEDKAESTAKNLQSRGKQAGQFFGEIRNQVLGLFAAITGGKALESFISDTVGTSAATGLLAHNLDMTTQELSLWQGAAERAGGSADGIAQTFQTLTQQLQQFQLTGESAIIPYLQNLVVQMADATGKARPMSEILLDIADKFQGMDPARASAIGAAMGFDQGTINLLEKGRSAVSAMLREQKQIGYTTDDDAKKSLILINAWRGMVQASEQVGRSLLNSLLPAMTWFANQMKRFAEWAQQHGPMVRAFFIGLAAAVVAFAAVLLWPIAGTIALTAAIGAAVAAIAVLYDDWNAWISGGKSEFGDFWQFFADKWAQILPIVQPIFKELQHLFTDWYAVAKDTLKLIYEIFFGTSDQIRAAWKALFGDLGKFGEDLVHDIAALAPRILAAFKTAFTAALDWVEKRLGAIWNAISGTHNADEGDPTADNGDDLAHRSYRFLQHLTDRSDDTDAPTGDVNSNPMYDANATQGERKSAAADLFGGLEHQYDLPAGLLDSDWSEETARGSGDMVSSVGAKGHFQFMDGTAKQYGVDDPYDLKQAATGAAKMYHDMLTKYGGDIRKAAAAFDWGTGNLDKDIAKHGADWDKFLPTETSNYIRKVTAPLAPNAGAKTAQGGSSVKSDTKVGSINVYPPNGDAKTIAQSIKPAVEEYSFASTANAGIS